MQSHSRLSLLVVGLFTSSLAFAADPGLVSTNPSAVPTTLVPAEPVAPVPEKPLIELTTMKLLLGKGLITQEEYDNAVKDMMGGGTSPTVTLAGFKTTIYGYAELNAMWDSTQSFSDLPGNGQVARPGTYAGQHPRFQGEMRDSRIGFRLAAPAWHDMKASGVMEFDLFGNAGVGNFLAAPGNVSEAGFWSNPVLRIRHAYGKIETPIVDVLFGQTWILFGSLPNYVPAVVQIPGMPGELFFREAQVRVSKTIKTEFVNVDLALAAMRPVQRDSATPEGQGLAKISFPKWTGWQAPYLNAMQLAPASLTVSGTLRQLAIGAPCTIPTGGTTCNSTQTYFLTGSGIAVDLFLPVIPGKKDDKSNSLSVSGSFVSGRSINDQYTGLTGGVGQYNATMFPGTAANGPLLDSGLAVYDTNNNVIQPWWITSFVNLQYYLPGGRVAIIGSWGHTQLNNAADLPTAKTALRNHSNFFEGGLFADVTASIRIAAAYDRMVDVYQDGVTATNDSIKATAFFFF
jgi:hypothetical protein